MDKEKGIRIALVAPVDSHIGHFMHAIAMKDNIVIVSPDEAKRSQFDPEPMRIKNYFEEFPERGWTKSHIRKDDVKSHYQNRAERRKKKFKR